MTFRVCLTGTESTGKSTLAPVLAARFGGVVVREYGRTWAEANGTQFRRADLRIIGDGQIFNRIGVEMSQPRLIVEDTDIIMTSAWSTMLFGSPDPQLQTLPATADLYLLFAPDTPWVNDGTRMFDGPRRAAFHALIVAELRQRGIVPVTIAGDWATRRDAAITAIACHLPPL